MKYVDLDASMTLPGGEVVDGVIDPSGYLERLPELADALPPGARAFATDPLHYDFLGPRCVKDLTLARISYGPDGADPSLELAFRHSCFKHDEDLTITYQGVTSCVLDLAGMRGEVILDEILPDPAGCAHEIAFRPGTIAVRCRDLAATWETAECDRRRPPVRT
ncbi:hypothetical protein OUY22_10035 [Nonomuraea sp. MCN248]|uniref:Uncharacterized protein n=1 Tax=Nonomuraea corallina TaxID=2989783 RepID=A0ABT4S961_9ACTN|nr:hypothetical protein [Nonomuraea corallina]MDA0633757.1 hypothetical protein [Nonomuraea corallina]